MRPSSERAAPSCLANRAAFPICELRRRRELLRTTDRAILPLMILTLVLVLVLLITES